MPTRQKKPKLWLRLTANNESHPSKEVYIFTPTKEIKRNQFLLMKVADESICAKIDIIYQLSNRVIEFYHANLQESAYHAALEWELKQAGFSVKSEQMFSLWYRGVKLDKFYKIDLVVDDFIIELKAKEEIVSEHRFQLFNYMRLTNMQWGLLINFGPTGIDIERYFYNQKLNRCILFDRFGQSVYNKN